MEFRFSSHPSLSRAAIQRPLKKSPRKKHSSPGACMERLIYQQCIMISNELKWKEAKRNEKFTRAIELSGEPPMELLPGRWQYRRERNLWSFAPFTDERVHPRSEPPLSSKVTDVTNSPPLPLFFVFSKDLCNPGSLKGADRPNRLGETVRENGSAAVERDRRGLWATHAAHGRPNAYEARVQQSSSPAERTHRKSCGRCQCRCRRSTCTFCMYRTTVSTKGNERMLRFHGSFSSWVPSDHKLFAARQANAGHYPTAQRIERFFFVR